MVVTGILSGCFSEAGDDGALPQASVAGAILYALRQPPSVSVDSLAMTATKLMHS